MTSPGEEGGNADREGWQRPPVPLMLRVQTRAVAQARARSVAPAEEARVAHVLCLRSTSAKEKPESLHT